MKVRNFLVLFIFALGILIMVLCAPKPAEPKVPSPGDIKNVINVSAHIDYDITQKEGDITDDNKTDLANHIIELCETLISDFGEKNFDNMEKRLYKAGAILEDWEEVGEHKKYKRKRPEKEIFKLFEKLWREDATLELDIRNIFIDSIDEERTVTDEQGQQRLVNWIARISVKFKILTPNPGNQTIGGSFEALHREDCPWGDPDE